MIIMHTFSISKEQKEEEMNELESQSEATVWQKWVSVRS